MKYLAKVCTSALTFGLLMVAGFAAVSANQVNGSQNQSSAQQTTEVKNYKEPKTYPIYHFTHHYNNAQNSLKKPVVYKQHVAVKHYARHFHYAVKPRKTAKTVKLAATSNSEANDQNQDQASNQTYSYKGNTYNSKDSYLAAKFTNTKLYKVATSKLGDPYVWGGNGPTVFDCSGFTKYVYKNAKHINLPRLAGDQYTYEKPVSYANIKPGNLVFFGAAPSAISHVGMYIGNGNMIDAQLRGVVIEKVIAPWWHLVGCAKVVRSYKY